MKRCLVTAALVLLAGTAQAAPVDFTTVLLGLDAKPKIECTRVNKVDRSKCDEEVQVTLGWLSRVALDAPEDKLQLSDIVKRGSLADKIKTNEKLELSIDEAKLLQDQIVKLNYNIELKFQAIGLINPNGIKDAK